MEYNGNTMVIRLYYKLIYILLPDNPIDISILFHLQSKFIQMNKLAIFSTNSIFIHFHLIE